MTQVRTHPMRLGVRAIAAWAAIAFGLMLMVLVVASMPAGTVAAADGHVPSTVEPGDSGTTEDESGIDTSVIYPWSDGNGLQDRWTDGLEIFLLGLVGGLTAVYLYLGTFLPGMTASASLGEAEAEVQINKAHRDAVLDRYRGAVELGQPPPLQAQELVERYDAIVARSTAQVRTERWRAQLLGMPLFAILGGAFAVLFASNLLQALLIGFGWTVVAKQAGLSRTQAQRREKKNEQISQLEVAASVERDQRIDAIEQLETASQRIDELEEIAQEYGVIKPKYDVLHAFVDAMRNPTDEEDRRGC